MKRLLATLICTAACCTNGWAYGPYGYATVYVPRPVVRVAYCPPAPVVYAPAPRVIYAPTPVTYVTTPVVYSAPTPIVYAPAPVVYAAPPVCDPLLAATVCLTTPWRICGPHHGWHGRW